MTKVCVHVCITNLGQSHCLPGLQLEAYATQLLFAPQKALYTLWPTVTHGLQNTNAEVFGQVINMR